MIYTFGEFELDLHLYELRAAGVQRPVEPQVFDVLVYLVTNRDRLVTKNELLENLWRDRFVAETTLTSRLMAARKAVGDDAKRQTWIKTVHGRGYRFVGEVSEAGRPPATDPLLVRPAEHAVAEARSLASDPPPAGDLVIGRDGELRRLRAIFVNAAEGMRQIVFVTGEAGAGKTTLVDSFLASLPVPMRIRAASGQCLEHRGTGEPYLPLLDALERLCRGAWGDELIEVLRRDAPTWAAQMPILGPAPAKDAGGDGGRERMLREMATVLDDLSTDTPLILVFEDLHWSDYSTLDLITTLARRRDGSRLMIIGTYRPADVKASRHPLYGIVQELLIRGQCKEIALPLLDGSDLETYVSRRFAGAPFSAKLAAVLHQRTGGNPLFAGSLLDWWVDQRFIVRDGAGWALAAGNETLAASIPDTVRLLIEQHVTELPVERQRILEAASVAGKEFAAATIATAADRDEVEIACAELAREGKFLRSTGSDIWPDGTITERFKFTHDLYPDVLYSRIPAGQRARIHRTIGAQLEDAWRGREREHAAELGLHFQRGGDAARTLTYERLAAEQALRRGAHYEAIEHLASALTAIENLSGTTDTRNDELEVRTSLAESIVATRGWGDVEAETSFLRARELANELQDRLQLSRVIYGLATMYEFRGDYRTSEALTQERLQLDYDASPEILLQSHELLTCSLMHQARFDEALVHANRAVDVINTILQKGEAPPVIGIQTRGWASAALMFLGLSDAALAESRIARKLADMSEDDLGRAVGYAQAACIHFYRREAGEASECAESGMSIGVENRFPFVVAVGRIIRGWCMAEFGEPLDVAVNEIRAGLRTCSMIGASMDSPLFLAIFADVALRAGLRDEALEAIEKALRTIDQARSFFYTPEVLRMRGVIAELEGTNGCAAEWYRKAIDLARAQKSSLLALRAAASLFRIDPTKRYELERALGDVVEGLDTADVREAKELLA